MHRKSEHAQQRNALLGEIVVGLDQILTADLQFDAGPQGIDVRVEAGSFAVLGQLLQGLGGLQLGSGGINLAFRGDHQQITGSHGQGYGLPGGVEGESGGTDIGSGGAGVLNVVQIDQILGHEDARVGVAEVQRRRHRYAEEVRAEALGRKVDFHARSRASRH